METAKTSFCFSETYFLGLTWYSLEFLRVYLDGRRADGHGPRKEGR